MTEPDLRERLQTFTGDPDELWHLCRPALAGTDLEERKAAIAALSNQASPDAHLPHLLAAVREQENANLRNAALEILGNLGPEVIPQLIGQLDDADAETRKFLIDVLGLIGSPVAAPRLAGMLRSDDANVRFAAIEALGKLAIPMAAEAILQHLRTTRDATETFVSLEALSHCVSRRAVDRLDLDALEPLRDDPLLTRPLLHLLAALRTPEADAFLWAWLPRLDEIRIQEAAKLLGGLPPDRLAATTTRLGRARLDLEAPVLRSLFRAIDPEVRAGTVWLAVWSGRIDPLLESFERDRVDEAHLLEAAPFAPADLFAPLFRNLRGADRERARVLIELAGRIGAAEQIDALLYLGEIHPPLRARVFRWAASLGDIDVLDWLPGLLAHPDQLDLLVAGLRDLLPVAHERIMAILRPWSEELEASDEWRTFLVLVEQLNLVALRNRVEIAWKRADPELRSAALTVLAHFRLEHARHYLSLALADESAQVRLTAAEILADVARPENESEVRTLLRDPAAWIRAEGLRTLLRLRGGEALESVERALDDPAPIVRLQALRALRSLHADARLDRIRRLLEPAVDVDVRCEAIQLLGRLGGEPHSGDEALLDDPHWRVRLEACLWLAETPRFRGLVDEHLRQENDPDVLGLTMKATRPS